MQFEIVQASIWNNKNNNTMSQKGQQTSRKEDQQRPEMK